MKVSKIARILRTIAVLDALRGKQGSYRLGEISQWACIPRATCNRYLVAISAMQLIEMVEEEYKGLPCREFKITDSGTFFKENWLE
jgi:hypothetical protein